MSKISEEIVDGGVKWDIKGPLMDNDDWFALATYIKDETNDPLCDLGLSINRLLWNEPATPDFIEFVRTIGAHQKLIKLRCNTTTKYLENNQQDVLFKELSKNRTIKHLSLNVEDFDQNKNHSLCKIFNNNQTLISLNIELSNCEIPMTNDMILQLSRSLQTTVLERLRINKIDDKMFEILLQHLPSKLIYLNLELNKITEESFPMLQSFIKSNRTLKQLILDDDLPPKYFDKYNNINALKIPIQILQASSFESKLALNEFRLDINTEEMTNDDWKIFIDELTNKNSNCRDLHVSIHNNINSKHFQQLLTLISREQCKLLRITISFFKLEKEKQFYLFDALYKNKSIQNFGFESKLDSDIYNLLLNIIKDKSTITHLRIENNKNLDDKDVSRLAQCLHKKTTLKELQLDNNRIGDKGFQVLLNSLPNSLQSLQLTDNFITAKSLPSLLNFLKEHSGLDKFQLGQNGISIQSKDVNVSHLLEEISNVATENGCICSIDINESIQEKMSEINNDNDIKINLSNKRLRDDHIIELCNSLKIKQNYRNQNWSFDLSNNPHISLFGFQHLVNILPIINIINLELISCDMDQDKIKVLFMGLEKNKTLKKLRLDSNQFGNKPIEHIARYLHNNTTLIYLNLNENNIKDEGAIHLSYVLSKTRLQELYLIKNSIGDRGCTSILSSLPSTLVILDLNDNQITRSSIDNIVEFLSSNRTLKDLYIDSNPIFGKHWYTDGFDTVKCWMRAREASEKNNICKLH